MLDIKTVFPKASKSFLGLNSAALEPYGEENALQTPPANVKRHSMTTPEREMAAQLEMMRRNNEIESWKFEGVTLKLADSCRYTPDFFVVVSSKIIAHLRIIETKGPFIREDAMIKFRVAKEQNPWAEWQLHQRTKNGWTQLL